MVQPRGKEGDTAETREVDLSALEPQIAKPFSPANVVPVRDIIEADLEKGTVKVNGEVKQFAPLAANVLKTLEYGGLIPRVRAELGLA